MNRPVALSLLPLLFLTSVSATPNVSVSLKPAGNYRTGVFDDGATEIVAYAPFTRRLFSVNAHEKCIDVLSIRDITAPTQLLSIDISPYGKNATSIAVKRGILAAVVQSKDTQAPGKLLLFQTWGKCRLISDCEVGPHPDMITFSPNGRYILVANEGEPNDDYTVDPEGSITIVDLRRSLRKPDISTATFDRFNCAKQQLIQKGVRIFGPDATVAQDFEPEYIAVAKDSRTAWVTLQENNAIAVINIRNAFVEKIIPLGYKDHNQPENRLDASNKDDQIYLNTWPVFGMYQPDAIAAFSIFGKHYYITANEGDSRDYDGFSEIERVKDVTLDEGAFPYAASLQEKQNLGRLEITTTRGDIDGDGDFDALYSFGGRSFSIFNDNGTCIFESGSLIEEITAEYYPDNFNCNDDENDSFDKRSDDKGPEPEGVAIGKVMGQTFAFIALERIGGIMTFNVTNPYTPRFIEYVNTRDFSGDPEDDNAGDLSPEGIIFVPAFQSPTKKPLVIAGYEISGSITIFEVQVERLCSHEPLKRSANCKK